MAMEELAARRLLGAWLFGRRGRMQDEAHRHAAAAGITQRSMHIIRSSLPLPAEREQAR
eukprot:CAMPEP_0179876146 /NCGR_PEP_ID=MMETSP0982-20121206/24031_1 /TAXON_ID=483367 /ORGANISM="non described non described, Strain CCMP 2436" /LENGTH=58 /DNA_ID=CAMNT_0021768519 /DNA_START=110 /DNA_END=282 /DNA_ORIENTATION=-